VTFVSCDIELNQQELQNYCTGAHTDKFQELEIFKQFYDKFRYVSIFGDARANYLKDFVKVIYVKDESPTTGTWNDASKTCTGTVGFNIRILTS
jgi:hypothetical protein